MSRSPYSASIARRDVSFPLLKAGRFAAARQDAEAALRDFQTFGPGAAKNGRMTLSITAIIAIMAKAATA